MIWLDRLKKLESTRETGPQNPQEAATTCVGFVGTVPGHPEKAEYGDVPSTGANPEAGRQDGYQGENANGKPPEGRALAVDIAGRLEVKKSGNTPACNLQNPQNAEISSFVGFVGTATGTMPNTTLVDDLIEARIALFTDRSLGVEDTAALVARLKIRDQEGDERRLCLECCHLLGRVSGRRCTQWRRLGIASEAIPSDLVMLLQRCAGFRERLVMK